MPASWLVPTSHLLLAAPLNFGGQHCIVTGVGTQCINGTIRCSSASIRCIKNPRVKRGNSARLERLKLFLGETIFDNGIPVNFIEGNYIRNSNFFLIATSSVIFNIWSPYMYSISQARAQADISTQTMALHFVLLWRCLSAAFCKVRVVKYTRLPRLG